MGRVLSLTGDWLIGNIAVTGMLMQYLHWLVRLELLIFFVDFFDFCAINVSYPVRALRPQKNRGLWVRIPSGSPYFMIP